MPDKAYSPQFCHNYPPNPQNLKHGRGILMRKFLKDTRGEVPITFYGMLMIVGAVAFAVVISRTPVLSVDEASIVRIKASNERCTNQVLGTKFGKKDCHTKKVNVTGDSIVFLKAK